LPLLLVIWQERPQRKVNCPGNPGGIYKAERISRNERFFAAVGSCTVVAAALAASSWVIKFAFLQD